MTTERIAESEAEVKKLRHQLGFANEEAFDQLDDTATALGLHRNEYDFNQLRDAARDCAYELEQAKEAKKKLQDDLATMTTDRNQAVKEKMEADTRTQRRASEDGQKIAALRDDETKCMGLVAKRGSFRCPSDAIEMLLSDLKSANDSVERLRKRALAAEAMFKQSGTVPEWVPRVLRECFGAIERGLDHSLHNVPGRVAVAKEALARIEQAVQRLLRPSLQAQYDALQKRLDDSKETLRLLVNSAQRIATTQPTSHVRTQRDSDVWTIFYRRLAAADLFLADGQVRTW